MRIAHYYWFSYHAAERDLREPGGRENRPENLDLHKVRDGAAFAELCGALPLGRFRYGGIVLNLPQHIVHRGGMRLDYILPGDLVILTTRPPLNDHELVERLPNRRTVRRVNRSFSDAEEAVFCSLSKVFSSCERQRVVLSDKVAAKLSEKEAVWCDCVFNVTRGAVVVQHRASERSNYTRLTSVRRTCGYLVFCPSIKPWGANLIASFGMGGVETLLFNHLLRTNELLKPLIPDALESGRRMISLVEFSVPDCPTTPLDLSFAGAANPQILFSVAIT